MIIRHTLNYTAVKLLPAMASLATLMLFTRLMSPAQFGEYTLTVNVTAMAVAIFGNFLVIGLGRFEPAARTVEERKKLHSTVIFTAIFLSIVAAVLTVFLALNDLLPNLSVNFYFASALFMLTLLLMLSQKLINANLKPKAYGASLALKNLLLLAAGATCLVAGYGVDEVLASLAIATLLASLPALNLWARTSWKSFDFSMLKQLWSYGAPLTLLYLFVTIISFSDRIFIDLMLGDEQLGLYSAGYDLTQYTIAAIASIIHLAAFPLILKVYEQEGEAKAKTLLSISIQVLLLVMVPVTAGFIAVKKELSEVILGSSFSEASIILMPLLAVSVLLSSVKSYYFDYAFQITKTTWLQVFPPVIAAIVNCILNYSFISRFGMIGAAYSTFCSYLIYLICSAFLARKVLEIPTFPWAFLAKVVFSAGVMVSILTISEFGLPVIIALVTKIIVGISLFIITLLFIAKKDLYYLKAGRF